MLSLRDHKTDGTAILSGSRLFVSPDEAGSGNSQKREWSFNVVHDPSEDGGFPVGSQFTFDEVHYMLKMGTFTDGTVVSFGRRLFVIFSVGDGVEHDGVKYKQVLTTTTGLWIVALGGAKQFTPRRIKRVYL